MKMLLPKKKFSNKFISIPDIPFRRSWPKATSRLLERQELRHVRKRQHSVASSAPGAYEPAAAASEMQAGKTDFSVFRLLSSPCAFLASQSVPFRFQFPPPDDTKPTHKWIARVRIRIFPTHKMEIDERRIAQLSSVC